MEQFLGLEAAAAAELAKNIGYDTVIVRTEPPRLMEKIDSERVIRAAIKDDGRLEFVVCGFCTAATQKSEELQDLG